MVGPGILEIGILIQGLLVGFESLLQLPGTSQGITPIVMTSGAGLVRKYLGGIIELAIPVQG
jgi:hypothetical protein